MALGRLSGEGTVVPLLPQASRPQQAAAEEPLALLGEDDAGGVVDDASPIVQDLIPDEGDADGGTLVDLAILRDKEPSRPARLPLGRREREARAGQEGDG